MGLEAPEEQRRWRKEVGRLRLVRQNVEVWVDQPPPERGLGLGVGRNVADADSQGGRQEGLVEVKGVIVSALKFQNKDEHYRKSTAAHTPHCRGMR